MKKSFKILLVLWLIVLVIGAVYISLPSKNKIYRLNITENTKINEKMEKVKIFIPDFSKNGIRAKNVEIPTSESLNERLRKLIKFQLDEMHKNKVVKSNKVELLNIYFEGDKIYLDFNKEIEELDLGDTKSVLVIYSLVNSITEFSSIKKVKILIDGKEGNKNLKATYERNDSFVL